MRRNVSLSEISDGKLYDGNDLVKADCHGCEGCFECCRGMGKSIVLDPYDVYRLTTGLGMTMEELMQTSVELNVVDGVVLPNLKMVGEEECCAFLNEDGRCGIHSYRPGICRLFPLGRYYENGSFRYFLQTEECHAKHTKVKVSKWIDTPQLRQNEAFITTWHYLINEVEELLRSNLEDVFCRKLNVFLLNTFYLAPYRTGDFYAQFEERLGSFRQCVTE